MHSLFAMMYSMELLLPKKSEEIVWYDLDNNVVVEESDGSLLQMPG